MFNANENNQANSVIFILENSIYLNWICTFRGEARDKPKWFLNSRDFKEAMVVSKKMKSSSTSSSGESHWAKKRALWLVEETMTDDNVIFWMVSKWPIWKNQNKKIAQENRDPLVTLTLNVQFWSAHHVHGTKLHPKRGYGEFNSMEVKSFATSNVYVWTIEL